MSELKNIDSLGKVPDTLDGFSEINKGTIAHGDLVIDNKGIKLWSFFTQGSCIPLMDGWKVYRRNLSVATPKPYPYFPDTFIPQDDETRKKSPIYRGLFGYFPAALFEVARHSFESDQKHNPGAKDGPTWARKKSSDHADCIPRHLIDSGTDDPEEKLRHLRSLAWRSLALLQEYCESRGAKPGVSSRWEDAQ